MGILSGRWRWVLDRYFQMSSRICYLRSIFVPILILNDGDREVMIKEANCLAAIGQILADRPNCYAGITGGFLPLAVTVATEQIYDRFYSDDPTKTLYHGHSYTANPLGCAAALASLELLAQNQPTYTQMETWHRQHLQQLGDKYPQLTRLRAIGTIAAIDIINQDQPGYLNRVGMEIRQQAIDCGILLRPLGNVLYLMPPYCITEAELGWVYQQIDQVLERVLS